MKLLEDTIKDLKENPYEWHHGDCTLRRKTKPYIAIWTANIPLFHMGFYQPMINLTIRQRLRLYKAVKQWRNSVSPFQEESRHEPN